MSHPTPPNDTAGRRSVDSNLQLPQNKIDVLNRDLAVETTVETADLCPSDSNLVVFSHAEIGRNLA